MSNIINKLTPVKKQASKSKSNVNILVEKQASKSKSVGVVEQRMIRQIDNYKTAEDAIIKNKCSKDNSNDEALKRVLSYTGYQSIEEILKDEKNYKNIIMKLISINIAKNASRQGCKDESFQLKNINTLQEYNIEIKKDGKLRPIKGGGISEVSRKKQLGELKTIDFVIYNNDKIIGYITAKVTVDQGGHQANVSDELESFMEWARIQQKNDNNVNERKIYVILFDSSNVSDTINMIKKKFNDDNSLITDSDNFHNDFLKWYKKEN